MKLINIKVADCQQSETNVRGRNEGKAFEDLVASIKEKGILVPVLARALKQLPLTWEVIAGNRRLAAVKKLGIETIPAQIVEMTDSEAREAQIVENLQRQDIHPLEEGELYRKLIEELKGAKVSSIAIRVGKSESYIKQRLFLTNLITPAADAYRADKISDSHAVLIAKLSSGDQTKALKVTIYNGMDIKDLKNWINENIYSPLERQPWLGSKEAMEIVGACQECEPNKASLFGPVKEGACTSIKCWARKMEKYIEWRVKEAKLTKVSCEYGQAPKGVYSMSDYVLVAKKGKDRCKSVQVGIVVDGAEIGKEIDICTDPHCQTHRGMKSQYGMTPAEQKRRKEERKKEIEKSKNEKEARKKLMEDTLKKLKWPMSVKHLDALLELAFENAGFNVARSIAKRRGLEVPKETNTWGSNSWDYTGAIEKLFKELDNAGKLRLAFELLIDDGYESFRKGIKKI
jgi:ParB family chromosome partitioning protein